MNPLLEKFTTPFETAPFEEIKNEHFLPAIKEAIAIGNKEIEAITGSIQEPDFENTIVALEKSGQLVDRIAGIFFNLNSAETNDQIQELAREISPLLSDYSNDKVLDAKLFKRIETVYNKRNTLKLDAEETTLLEKTFKHFVRNGAGLSDFQKNRLREIDQELSQLSLLFGENVLKETNSYSLIVDNQEELAGLPEDVLEAAAQDAKDLNEEGKWAFTLQYPSYIPFITYAENRQLRKQLFLANGAKAFKGDKNDNQSIILNMVKLRLERAKLLGYKSHADFVLEERMAESPQKVFDFLDNLKHYALPVAAKEVEELNAFAKSIGGPDKLERWDMAYYSEKLKKKTYAIDDELLKPYFQLEKSIEGVFIVAQKLFGLTFHEVNNVQKYHPDVKVYEVKDEKDRHIAVFYADFFPRPGKRNGAWMTSFRGQKKENGVDIRPHVSIVCNFTKPTASKPSLLTFNEVTTLFHEFGHALHGMLANGKFESLSGTNVYWDFVELPSQVLENWAYEKECLDLFAKHYQTGQEIPIDLINRIKESANFMEGYQTIRQIGLAKLDMGWHTEHIANIESVGEYEKELQKETDLLEPVDGTNTSCSFSHIFQGGYASGYYSYKWAEVLDADTFEFFQEKGLFNRETADLFNQHILSAGGSEHPMELYKRFRGKAPMPDALLRRTGMLKK